MLSDLGDQLSGGDTRPIGLLSAIIHVLTVVVGLLIRSGRAWLDSDAESAAATAPRDWRP